MHIDTPKTVDFALIVRGIAAVNVIIWHLWGSHTNASDPYHPLVISGRLSVWVFFALSGYLIAFGFYSGKYDLHLKNIIRFYKNRLLRIYPLFLFVSLVSIAFGIVSLDSIGWKFLARELLMLQWNHEYTLNGVFWTLGVETHFYLCAPFIFLFQEKLLGKFKFLHLPIVVILYSIAFKLNFIEHFDLRNFLGNYMIFAFGFALAGFRDSWDKKYDKKKITFLSFAALVLVVFINKAYFDGKFWSLEYTFLSGLFAALLLAIHCLIENRKFRPGLVTNALMKLGVLSYGLYAWHGFLLKINLATDNLLLAILIPTLLAYISYLAVEKPLLPFKS